MEDTFVAALLRTCCRAAVFWGLGAVGEAVSGLATFPGYGELVRVFAIFPQHLWEQSPPRVNEPVAHLEHTTKIHALRTLHHTTRLCSALQFKRKSAGTLIPRCLMHLCFQKRNQRVTTAYRTSWFHQRQCISHYYNFPFAYWTMQKWETWCLEDLRWQLKLWDANFHSLFGFINPSSKVINFFCQSSNHSHLSPFYPQSCRLVVTGSARLVALTM